MSAISCKPTKSVVFQWKRVVSGSSACLGPEMMKFGPNFSYCAVEQEKTFFSMEMGRFWSICLSGAQNVYQTSSRPLADLEKTCQNLFKTLPSYYRFFQNLLKSPRNKIFKNLVLILLLVLLLLILLLVLILLLLLRLLLLLLRLLRRSSLAIARSLPRSPSGSTSSTTTTNTNITSTTTVDLDLKSFLKSNNYIIKYRKLTFTSGSNFSPSDHSGYNFYCIHKYYFT